MPDGAALRGPTEEINPAVGRASAAQPDGGRRQGPAG